MGWFGLVGLVSLLGSIIGVAVAGLRKASRGLEAELLVGTTASMIIFAVHAYFEWITMFYNIHYLAGIAAGLIVGLRALSAKKVERRKVRTAAASRSDLALQ